MSTSERLKIQNFIWLAVSLLVLLALIGLSFYKQSQSSNALLRTWEVKTLITDIISGMKDAETGQRGYVMTSETDYLAPYHNAVTSYEKQISKLKSLTGNDSVQLYNIKRIDSAITEKIYQLKKNIDLVENSQDSVAVERIKIKIGKSTMDDIRSIGKEIYAKQEEQLLQIEDDFDDWRALTIILAIISAAIIIYSILKIYREVYPVFNKMIETRQELQNASANLSETVNELEKAKAEGLNVLNEKEIIINAQKTKIKTLEKELERYK